MGESNSRTSDANRVHYHYANGPRRDWLRAFGICFNKFLSLSAVAPYPKNPL